MKTFNGTFFNLPPDKSISHRTALIGALSNGITEITNYSAGLDNQTTLSVLQSLGVDIQQESFLTNDGYEQRKVVIKSSGLWSLSRSKRELMCNNSGSTIRMLSGILAAQPFRTTLVGDHSLMKRPMRRVAEPLTQMGASIKLSETGAPPIEIEGKKPLSPIQFYQKIPSAQVKSLVIFAALHADGISEIIEPIQTRNHTELMLGLEPELQPDGSRKIVIEGQKNIEAKPFTVPADPSGACFLVALGLLSGKSDIRLKNVGLNHTRAGYLSLLREAGAKLPTENNRTIGGELLGDIIISNDYITKPLRINDAQIVSDIIDEIPMLAVLSAMATGEFELHHAAELRAKESDRIHALVMNLQRLGFVCEEYKDGFCVTGRTHNPTGTIEITTFYDHRIAMSFAIAGHFSNAEIQLDDNSSIAVSFPNFFSLIDSMQKT
ncbi:3-phosphoshikimate 1-carboxyvinyltransferase [Chloroherpeton thalassium ATCC 35110]|uniref:3-phosphoshikimate 1-carboxyvinyltransferase n=1 Tax=Chloroherpeton thalassium (strain ATCC 35110 / GB-78) TaxID=517418 RepID=AROA_CHLT3|nr:3-phosphoshikimate 1-carboxyvinyltransferase [Chloroherpeton thalassium]B3QZC7.1 RecName: Full=3-phosphoshikimate 1-carboxyvinyltransferase; AltName: Full=5-enolpyruvylshikimate-3-phosphate synthase; Short=EPSP synthase; Short=EPSPS [Chloroherpeton thalassium ATCC 35110]ACF13820.1 3-phosphoshikimate 1-carboxyvinyltransferase [Chloroherpeton thalassium ATCC 35110]